MNEREGKGQNFLWSDTDSEMWGGLIRVYKRKCRSVKIVFGIFAFGANIFFFGGAKIMFGINCF